MSLKINNPNHPVILFIPEAGIYPFTRGLAFLGDAIKKSGGSVFITHDTGQMLRSPIMAMYRTSVVLSQKERKNIYKATEKNVDDVLKNYDFSSIELSGFVDSKLTEEIDQLVKKGKNDLRKISYRGFPVGKMAEFDFILETKYPYYPNLSIPHRKLYIQYVKNTALAVAISDGICKHYKPSLIITFSEYAQCQAARYGAKMNSVRHLSLAYPVHLNIDASRFLLWQFTNRYWMSNHIRKWNKWKKLPINEVHVAASWRDSLYRMYGSGSHIFSPRKENNPAIIFDRLKLDPKRKTVVVYTSGQDERKCSEIAMSVWGEKDLAVDVFSSHIEWLSMLRDYVSKRDDVQMVIRIHPREGSRQFGFDSQHLSRLKAKFKKNSPNFTVIWPDDPISSYDLMELADVCLVAWSTVGQEAAKVGIPVLSCVSKLYYPNDDFILTATTPKEYKRKLNEMLRFDYKWKYLVKAVRFYHWRTFIPSLDFKKVIPSDFDDRTIWPRVPSSMVDVVNDILSGKSDPIEYNIKKWGMSLPKNALFQEKEAMKKGIRYFIDKIYYPPYNFGMASRILRFAWRKITGSVLWVPPDLFKDYHLKYTEDVSRIKEYIIKTKHNSKLRYLVASGSISILIHRGRVLKRMSPMVIRLAKLHENA